MSEAAVRAEVEALRRRVAGLEEQLRLVERRLVSQLGAVDAGYTGTHDAVRFERGRAMEIVSG